MVSYNWLVSHKFRVIHKNKIKKRKGFYATNVANVDLKRSFWIKLQHAVAY